MNKKNWLKISCSLLLVVCLLAGITLHYIPHISKASSSVTAELEAAGYKKVTPADFGLKDGKYDNTTNKAVGYYGQQLKESLDMTYLDVDISFAGGTSSDNSIRFADLGGPGISISGITSVSRPGDELVYVKDASDNSEATGYYEEVSGISTIKTTFNLKFAVKYGTESGGQTPVTYNMWINDMKVATDKVVNVKVLGKGMSIIVNPGEWVEIGASGQDTQDDVKNELEAAGYTRVTPEDFGLSYGMYDNNTAKAIGYYGKQLTESLNMTYLDVDISFAGGTSSDNSIRFADLNGPGISISGITSVSRPGDELVYVKDASDNSEATGYYEEISGISTIKTTFNLKFAVKYGTESGGQTPVTYNMWINNVKVTTDKVVNVKVLGKGMSLIVNPGEWIKIDAPTEGTGAEDVTAELEAAGYKRVIPKDFGLEDGTYENPTNAAKAYYGKQLTESLDMTYLDVDISFAGGTSSDNSIRFADLSGPGISISGITSVSRPGDELVYVKDASDNSEATGYYEEVSGISTIKTTFNLKFALKYGTESGGQTPVTYNMWINNVKVATDKVVNVKVLGKGMSLIVNPGEWIKIGKTGDAPEIPKAEATPEELGYAKITPKSFGLNNGSYNSTTMPNKTVQYGTALTTSLNKTFLDIDLSYMGTTSNTALRFAGNGDSGILISGYYSSSRNAEYLLITDASDRKEADTTEYSMEELGIDSLGNTFNMRFAIDLGSTTGAETALTYTMWINGKKVAEKKAMTVTNVGSNLGIHVAEGDTITLASPGLPSDESLAQRTPEQLGFEEISIMDFGLAAGEYKPTTNAKHVVKTYMGDTLSGKYFNVDLSVNLTDASGNENAVNYGSQDGWGGLRIYLRKDGLRIGNPNSKYDYFDYSFERLGLQNLSDTFNLKLGVKYGIEYQAGSTTQSDLTYSLWINDVLIAQDVTYRGVKATGNRLGIYAKDGVITVTKAKAAGEKSEILPDYRMITLSTFGLADCEVKYENKVATKSDLSLFLLDGVTFSTDIYFQKKSGGDIRYGGKDIYSGLWLYSDADGFLNLRAVTPKGYVTETYTFSSFGAGTELTETWINVKITTKIVDSDGDGIKDDVKAGIWFNDVLYENEYIYIVDYAEMLGVRLSVFAQAEGSFIRVKSDPNVDASVDFTLFGFTKNWEKEYGLK